VWLMGVMEAKHPSATPPLPRHPCCAFQVYELKKTAPQQAGAVKPSQQQQQQQQQQQ